MTSFVATEFRQGMQSILDELQTLRRDDILCGRSSRQSTVRMRCCFKRSDAMISFVASPGGDRVPDPLDFKRSDAMISFVAPSLPPASCDA
jgi:hypothetical protein